MRLFILGANGKVGTQLIDLALSRTHQVTAFVRSPDRDSAGCSNQPAFPTTSADRTRPAAPAACLPLERAAPVPRFLNPGV